MFLKAKAQKVGSFICIELQVELDAHTKFW